MTTSSSSDAEIQPPKVPVHMLQNQPEDEKTEPVPPPPPMEPLNRASRANPSKNFRKDYPAKPLDNQKKRRNGLESSLIVQAHQAPGESATEEVLNETVQTAPAWLVSMLIHLLLLIILALFSKAIDSGFGSIVIDLGSPDPQQEELSILPMEALEEEEEPEELTNERAVEIEEIEVEEITAEPVVEFGILKAKPVATSRPMVTGRRGIMKRSLLAAFGGTGKTEDAVALGLAWLASKQQKDGAWRLDGPFPNGASTPNKASATGMALLAFLGAGQTHTEGQYRRQIGRGFRYLIDQQDRSGFFASKTRKTDARMYSQAQCTIALSELYAMTKDSRFKEPLRRAVDFAVQSQSSLGGWRYHPNGESDVSVTGWFVMALESARSAEIEVKQEVFYNVSRFLDSVQKYNGAAYGYVVGRDPSPAMTAEGLLCRQYLGWKRDRRAMVRGVNTLATDYNFNIKTKNFYYWYYATQVLHHYGGSQWNRWNQKMRVQLPAAQVKKDNEKGSWSPVGSEWGDVGGRLYTTCLAIYCLEVYYRHLPLYINAARKQADPEQEPVVDDRAVPFGF